MTPNRIIYARNGSVQMGIVAKRYGYFQIWRHASGRKREIYKEVKTFELMHAKDVHPEQHQAHINDIQFQNKSKNKWEK